MLTIGISGGSGSGKTTVVDKLKKSISEDIVILHLDSYYKDSSCLTEREKRDMNFDHPDSIDFDLLVSHIKELKEGRSVEQPVYSYITCTRSTVETVHTAPADVIIVEGILCFCCEKLMHELDIKIYVDTDDDVRLMRIIRRDIHERGKDVDWVLERYEKSVKPMYHAYIEPRKRDADIIIPGGTENDVAIGVLATMIERSFAK